MENNNLNHSSSMAKPMDAWKYIRKAGGCFTPEQIAANPYLNPKKVPDVPPGSPLPDSSSSDPAVPTGAVSGSVAGWLTLTDIVCRGADNKPFEEYSAIYVAKDVIRTPNGSVDTSFTPYKGITYFESQSNGMFLPSFALSCNILAALYAGMQKGDTEAQAILDQYKDHGAGYGWHAQNTLVQWNGRNSKVLHYPYDDQFLRNGGRDGVNQQGLHKELSFNSKDFGDVPLEEALKKKEFVRYIKNLTGLPNPNILVDIGKYFGKPAKIWVPNDQDAVNDTRAAWLGCSHGDFDMYTSYVLSYSNAALGVRRAP